METSTQPRHCIVFVLGPPGGGKGTVCNLAIEKLSLARSSYRHLSVGDYLRELCETRAPRENFDIEKVRNHLRESRLLPANVLIPVLEHKINSVPDGIDVSTTWLVDGFPRNVETALAFEEKISKPAKVIVLACTHENARRRFLARSRENNDDEEKFEKRYGEYVENMVAICEHYRDTIETICVDGTPHEYLDNFIAALPRFST